DCDLAVGAASCWLFARAAAAVGLGFDFAWGVGRGAVMTITPSLSFLELDCCRFREWAEAERTRPKRALPASKAAARQSTAKANPALRRLLPFSVIPKRRVTRDASGPRFAAIANEGAARHSSMRARARAYSAGLPQVVRATSSQQFSRSARIRLLSHHTAGW